MKIKIGFLLIVLTIFLEFLAFPPVNFSYLAFIALVPMYYFLYQEKRIWPRFFGIFFYRFVLASFTIYFIFEPIMWIQSALLLALMVFPLAVIEKKISSKINLIYIPILWAIFEHIEARYTFIGNYIMTLGNLLGNTPFVGLARLGGLFPLTLFVSTINTFFLVLFISLKKNKKIIKKERKFMSLVLILLIVFLLYGFILSKIFLIQNQSYYQNLKNKLNIAIVSTSKNYTFSLQQFGDMKLSPELEKEAANELMILFAPIENEIHLQEKKIGKTDLIFLPDDFIEKEYLLFSTGDDIIKKKYGIENGALVINSYQKLAQRHNNYVLTSMVTYRNGTHYNSMLLFDSSGELISIYDKVHLTFGSEYWPFNFSIFNFYDTFLGTSYFSNIIRSFSPELNDSASTFRIKFKAGKPKAFSIDNLNLKFITPICNEAHYIHEIAKYAKEFDSKIIFVTSGNRWIRGGLNNYIELFLNLKKIEAVYIKKPIVMNGRPEGAGVILPNGKFYGKHYSEEEFLVYLAEVKF